MSVHQIILSKLGFLDKIFSKKKKTILFISNKVYKDLKKKEKEKKRKQGKHRKSFRRERVIV